VRFRVLLFAGLRERYGRDAVECELSGDPPTAGELRAELEAQLEDLAAQGCRLAVDAAYARDEDPLPPGAECALVPPVSGG
jgi:molybdopterin converting factor small subunit